MEIFIGVLDGDGYIEIGPQKQYSKNPNYQPKSTIRSRIVLRLHKRDKELLELFKNTLKIGKIDELKKENPASVRTCVLLNKLHDRKVDDFTVDFVGLDVADRYVYGCGMDYYGYLRHMPGIYALKEE